MTVSTSESVIQYDGNGATVAFPVPFRFLANDDLVVTKTADGIDNILVLGTDYSVTGAGSLSGGTVTTSIAPAADDRITISREMVPVQETDLRNQGKYLAQTHENVFDYLTMLIQQNAGGLRQAIRVSAADPEPARLPPAASRANLLMGFNSSGDPVPVAPVSGSASDLALQLLNAIDPAKGATMIGFGGRNVREKLLGFGIDVMDNGAVADYDVLAATGTDNTAAFQACLDTIALMGGGVLRVPAGKYRITGALSIQNVPLVIVGDGIDNSMVVQTTAGANGLNFTSTIDTNRVDGWSGHGGQAISLAMRDLSLCTTVEAGRAINVSMTAATLNLTFLQIDRVAVKSLLSGLVGWEFGIYGHNLNGTKISHFYFMGDATNGSIDSAAPYYSQCGIRLTGDDPTGFISHYWSGITIYCANRGVWISDHYEGFYISQFEFVFVGTGAYIDTSTLTNFHIENGHMDFKSIGIYAQNVSGFRSVNVDYLKQGGAPLSPEPTTEGSNVILESCNGASIIGGRAWSFSAADNSDGIAVSNSVEFLVQSVDIKGMGELNNGVSVSSASKGKVDGCTITDVGDGVLVTGSSSEVVVSGNVISVLAGVSGRFGVILDAATTNCTVEGNSAITNVDSAVANNGAGNYIYDNTGPGAQHSSFTSGDTSPDIDNTGARVFSTANAGATSITTFDGGYVGMEITVIAGDANTTIVHGAAVSVPIVTKTGANISMALNSTARFVRGPGGWHQV